MNQLRHVVHSLPRSSRPRRSQRAAAPYPISGAASSGYCQINPQSGCRNASDFRRVNLPPMATEQRQHFTGYGRQQNDEQPKIAFSTCCQRNASMDRTIGHSNSPLVDRDESNANKPIFTNESPGNENEMPEPRNYAKLIADYSKAMEKPDLNSKGKDWPTGLLSRLPIESLVSSLGPYDKNSKIFKVSEASSKQSNHTLTKTCLKTDKTNNSQKRDYFTKKGENDFDIICDVTEEANRRRNDDYKVNKVPSNFATLNDNQCQLNCTVGSQEKIAMSQQQLDRSRSRSIRIDQTESSKSDKSKRKDKQKNDVLPWWTTPDSILNERYEKAERSLSYSTPEIKVIYSEKLQPEKLASLSKTKQYIKEELEKQKAKKRNIRQTGKLGKLKDIDGKEVEEEKSKSGAKLSKMMDRDGETTEDRIIRSSGSSGSISEKKSNGTAEASEVRAQKQARKQPIDQDYIVKRVREPLKPLEKKKDGTLIDYGLKVPTRRPKKKKQPATDERNPEKKNSAGCSISHQALLNTLENGKNNNNNNSKQSTSNCSGERLVNSSQQQPQQPQQPQQQSRSEQMFRRAHLADVAEDSWRSNCRSSRCGSEKQLIYSAWLDRLHCTAAARFVDTCCT